MTGTVAAIVVAAGRGERAGGDVPKQYRNIAGEPMIRPTLRAFLNHSLIGVVQPVINASDEAALSRRDCRSGKIAGAGSRRRNASGLSASRA